MRGHPAGTHLKPRFYTDEELLSLPVEFSLEEYTAVELARIWGISRSWANDIRMHPSWIDQREAVEGEGEPLLSDKRIQMLRQYQMGGAV